MFGFSRYNYDRFDKATLAKELAADQFGGSPQPGDKAPDFELRTVDGEKVRLSEFRGEKNVVLTFGSASCPLTAGSIDGLNELAEEYSSDNVQFLMVYVREAHPGENLPAHESMQDKLRAAELFREEEQIVMPVLIDELNGKVHRKYGGLPNPTFLIDKSGRIAFRALSTRPRVIAEGLDELLERQKERGVEHAIVREGEDSVVPSLRSMLHSYRALERAGNSALDNFGAEFGIPGRAIIATSRAIRPVADNPAASIGAAAAIVGVVGLGLWAGHQLRRRRLGMQDPYRYPDYRRTAGGYDDYEAVGI